MCSPGSRCDDGRMPHVPPKPHDPPEPRSLSSCLSFPTDPTHQQTPPKLNPRPPKVSLPGPRHPPCGSPLAGRLFLGKSGPGSWPGAPAAIVIFPSSVANAGPRSTSQSISHPPGEPRQHRLRDKPGDGGSPATSHSQQRHHRDFTPNNGTNREQAAEHILPFPGIFLPPPSAIFQLSARSCGSDVVSARG